MENEFLNKKKIALSIIYSYPAKNESNLSHSNNFHKILFHIFDLSFHISRIVSKLKTIMFLQFVKSVRKTPYADHQRSIRKANIFHYMEIIAQF